MPTSIPPEGRLWRWRHPQKRRWYCLFVGPDLFGDLVLIRAWGSLDSQRGGQMREVLASGEAIELRLRAIARQRVRHGYLSCPCDEKNP